MARRNEHSLDEIKAMVLDAAETIVIDKGYSALTVRRIAQQIGYTVASIYMVFDNMTELAWHLKARTLDDLAAQLRRLPACEPTQQITELAQAYVQFARDNFNRWRMLCGQDNRSPGWYRDKTGQISALVEAQFALLSPNRPAVEYQLAAKALWSGVHGICALTLTGDEDAAGDAEQAVLLLVENFIEGWRRRMA